MVTYTTKHPVSNAIDKELVIIERQSKKSKDSKFSNTAYNEINNLQASNSQLLCFSTASKNHIVFVSLQLCKA